MFSRRNRGFIGTCCILVLIVLFGYGLYMYDLKSVQLTESEALRHRSERSEKKSQERLDKLRAEKKALENDLENAKVELSQTSKRLDIELEQRQQRENEATNLGRELQSSKDKERECSEKTEHLDEQIMDKDEAIKDLKHKLEVKDTVYLNCVTEKNKIEQEKLQLQTELDHLIETKTDEESKAQDRVVILESELKQYKAELMELKDALGQLEVKGIKRDNHWVDLSEEVRGTILRGILDHDVYPNEFLGAEVLPTPEDKLDVPEAERKADVEVVNQEPIKEAPEEQAVPPQVQDTENQDSLDSKEEDNDDEDVDEKPAE